MTTLLGFQGLENNIDFFDEIYWSTFPGITVIADVSASPGSLPPS